MERMRAIAKLDKPTLWCPGMVVVLKKSGNICFALT